jgi:hypothetical protein
MFQKKKVISLEEYKQHRRVVLQKQLEKVIAQPDKETKEIRRKQRNKKLIGTAVIIAAAGIITLIVKKKK